MLCLYEISSLIVTDLEQSIQKGPTKTCTRQSLKNLNEYGLFKQTILLQII